jgi:hypothetical protein
MNPRIRHTDMTERFYSYYYFYFEVCPCAQEDEA